MVVPLRCPDSPFAILLSYSALFPYLIDNSETVYLENVDKCLVVAMTTKAQILQTHGVFDTI